MVSLSLFSASEDVFEGADVGETAGDTEDVSEEAFVSDGAEDFVLEHPNAENEMRVSIAALSISFSYTWKNPPVFIIMWLLYAFVLGFCKIQSPFF